MISREHFGNTVFAGFTIGVRYLGVGSAAYISRFGCGKPRLIYTKESRQIRCAMRCTAGQMNSDDVPDGRSVICFLGAGDCGCARPNIAGELPESTLRNRGLGISERRCEGVCYRALRSMRRYWMASPRCVLCTDSAPAKSAMERATLRMRW